VVGMRLERARKKLRAHGFDISVDKIYSNRIAPGKVVRTTPAAGDIISQGSRVTAAVSAGPEFEQLTLPDVRNTSVAGARSKLRGRGLRVEVVQSCGGGDTVVETDPIQGTTVRENDLVALFVC
ncbi:MAG: PASTA domain-containing protein, partial [Actinomycetota bacterium]